MLKITKTIIHLILWGLSANSFAVEVIKTKNLAGLPYPISNNAVAKLQTDDGLVLFTFKGIKKNKSWQDTTLDSFSLSVGDKSWHKISSVPEDVGELAATAVSIGSKVFVFGGYTVASDYSERTVAQSYEYDFKSDSYTPIPEIPVAVDDSVSFTIADRYIYLVSGWHNSGNVNLTQVYDTVEKKWFQATPYPGTAVFGHAGAAVGNSLIICDGVEKNILNDATHEYNATNICFKGEINIDKPYIVKWKPIEKHEGAALYRMAAGGYHGQGDWIIFAGGSTNPYNFDGIGYDKKLAEPSDMVMAYSLDKDLWQVVGRLDHPSMDHRGLLISEDRFFIIGGMTGGQKVTADVVEFCLNESKGKLSFC